MFTTAMFLGIGVGVVWWPASQTIAAIKEQAELQYEQANQNEAVVQHAAQLHAVAKRVADDVRQLSGGSQSAVTAATLTLLNRESHAHTIDIRSIVPAPVAAASAAPRPPDSTLTGTAIEIDARGGFRDILAFISDLPRHNVLIDVSDINITERGDHSPKPVLGATIHATVFRYKSIKEGEIEHASGAL
jgi:Tfp pilus assembly protein PilO